MSEQAAAPAAAPAAPATNGSSAPAELPRVVHAGDSFEDFMGQVGDRARAQQRLDQPPAPPKTVNPQPQPAEQTTPEDPTAEQRASNEPEKQEAQAGQWSQEDIDLLAKAKQWLESETIPEEFMKKLVAMKNGDQTDYESFEEVHGGRMRQREFQREMNKMDREREATGAELGFYKQHFAAIFDDANDGAAGGEAMYEIFTRAGKRKQLLALGKKLAQDEQGLVDGANGMGFAVMQRLGLKGKEGWNDHRVQDAIKQEYQRRQTELDREAQFRANEFKIQRYESQQQQRQQTQVGEEHWATQRKRMEQLRPRAFEARGLDPANASHNDAFDHWLGVIVRQKKTNEVTPEIVMAAARAAKEEVDERAKGGNGPAPKPKGFQPQLGAGGGKAPAAGGGQRMDADQVADKYGFPRW